MMMARDMGAYVGTADALRQRNPHNRIQPARLRNIELQLQRFNARLQRVRTALMTREPTLERLRAHQSQRLMEREHTGHWRGVMVGRVVPEIRCQRRVETPVRGWNGTRHDALPCRFRERE